MMETQLLSAHSPQEFALASDVAAGIIQAGGLVAFPTETVYGLGANALSPEAVAGIFRAKSRPQDNPLIVHIAKAEQLEPLVQAIPPRAQALIDAFWPGPLTIILPKTERVPLSTSGGLDTVAVRMPNHPLALVIIEKSGLPIAAPSANRSGSPSPTTARHCVEDLNGRVELIVDGGSCAVGVESTVLTLAGDVPRLLRPGAVTVEQLREILGHVEVDPAVEHLLDPSKPALSPGMKYKHYAPKAGVLLVSGSFEQFARYAEQNKAPGVWALVFDGEEAGISLPAITYGKEDHPEEQAASLFTALRRLDEVGAQSVLARMPDRKGLGLAVYNRLIRAAGFKVVEL
ncbi:L-threonylcarbamoyladenylate synthase [Oscillospiraceae bacterium MB08-C2-2]|nr:L-threonylcarbamoyladenylate synthase [Oscillospiraceae bacterium MB08-C2-2]